jgi:hypothetical protein
MQIKDKVGVFNRILIRGSIEINGFQERSSFFRQDF